MVEVVVINEVDSKGTVVGVGGLVFGLTKCLEGVCQSLKAPDQLVRAEIFGDL